MENRFVSLDCKNLHIHKNKIRNRSINQAITLYVHESFGITLECTLGTHVVYDRVICYAS